MSARIHARQAIATSSVLSENCHRPDFEGLGGAEVMPLSIPQGGGCSHKGLVATAGSGFRRKKDENLTESLFGGPDSEGLLLLVERPSGFDLLGQRSAEAPLRTCGSSVAARIHARRRAES